MSSKTPPFIKGVAATANAVTDQQNALPALQRELTELRAQCEMQSKKLSFAGITIDELAIRLAAAKEQCATKDARIKELERSLEAKRPNPDLIGSQPVPLAKGQQMEQFKHDNAGAAGTKRKLSESQGTSSPLPRPFGKQQREEGTEPVKRYATTLTQQAPKPAPKAMDFGRPSWVERLEADRRLEAAKAIKNVDVLAPTQQAPKANPRLMNLGKPRPIELLEFARRREAAEAYKNVDVLALMRQAQEEEDAAKKKEEDEAAKKKEALTVGPKPAQ